MDWVTDNFWLVIIYCDQGSFWAALTNPLGIAASIAVLLLGAVWGERRRGLWFVLFSIWFLAPLHHFSIEGTAPSAGDVAGYASMGAFGLGVLLVIGLGLYTFLIKE